MTKHCNFKSKIIIFFLITVFALTTVASFVNVAEAQSLYAYEFQGPYYLDGSIANTNTVVCSLVWANFTSTSLTLSTSGPFTLYVYSNVALYQMTWNASDVMNATVGQGLRAFNTPTSSGGQPIIYVYIPKPTSPFSLYTFSVTDFAGMTNAFLEMTINNQTNGASSISESVNLNSINTPSFIMTEYYTYTLTFICDQGSYSQQFTAENTLSNNLLVLAGAFPPLNGTVPNADVERLNSTLIGITYVDPSNKTFSLSVVITHQSGATTIYDYTNFIPSNTLTILWNLADPSTSYNVNVTSNIAGTTYIWALVAPSSAASNPWLGTWDWLGSSVQTMPYVTSGWPLGMTTGDIGEIVAGLIILFFLSIGSFRSSGPICIIAWVMSGFLIAFGWWGNGTTGALGAIPEFALSGFIAIMIQIDEAKQVAREV
jgi:hypothetical protein